MLKNTIAVLEFKKGYIQEQIEPKENEIKELKEQMQEVRNVYYYCILQHFTATFINIVNKHCYICSNVSVDL